MTYLQIHWENDEGLHHEESWERGNDGILYAIFQAIINLIHAIEKNQ